MGYSTIQKFRLSLKNNPKEFFELIGKEERYR